MGCGSSSDSVTPYNDNKNQKGEYVRFRDAPGYQDEGAKMRGPGTGSAPRKQSSQIRFSEQAGDRPKTGEEGDFNLPEVEFGGGMLGITADDQIKSLLNGMPEGQLFVDDDFPAVNSSMYVSDKHDMDIKWMRPHEIVSNPKLFIDGANRRDVIQGALGDCWFLSSCAAVARKTKLMERVIPPNQPLFGDDYRGIIKCSFWRFGSWATVVIDDLLPTKDGQLIFAKSGDDREFWAALVEKAYAKIHGSYETLEGGQSMDAMVDLTGGLAERYDIEEVITTKDNNPSNLRKKLYRLILKSSKNGAFITASRKGDWRMAYKTDENGLVEGHAYTISGVCRVRHRSMGVVNLIRVRNPWGNDAEWSGGWGDGDANWDGVSEAQRLKVECADLADGEFWMNFEDFCKEFEEVSLCTLGPDFDKDGSVDHVGEVKAIKGEWVIGRTAGGSRNNFDFFATNPQFLLTVHNPEDVDDEISGEDGDSDEENIERTSVLISLLQEYRRSKREADVKKYQIAFLVYKTKDPDNPLPMEHFMYNYETGTSGTYINCREVMARMELLPGDYVIIPATYLPNSPADFMVRVYSTRKFALKPLKV